MIKAVLFVGLGGGIGSILRFLTSVLINKYWTHPFPFATFTVNIVGCILIGLFIGLSERYGVLNGDLKFLLITGFCGGYTTFSTFSFENLLLYQNGYYFTLIAYIFLSIVFGLFAVWLGSAISKL